MLDGRVCMCLCCCARLDASHWSKCRYDGWWDGLVWGEVTVSGFLMGSCGLICQFWTELLTEAPGSVDTQTRTHMQDSSILKHYLVGSADTIRWLTAILKSFTGNCDGHFSLFWHLINWAGKEILSQVWVFLLLQLLLRLKMTLKIANMSTVSTNNETKWQIQTKPVLPDKLRGMEKTLVF